MTFLSKIISTGELGDTMAAATEKDSKKAKSNKANKLQGFLFIGVIPTLFAVVVLLIVLSFSGINVFEKTKEMGLKLPFVDDHLETDGSKTQEEWGKVVMELEGKIKDREAEMSQLKKKLLEKDKEIQAVILQKEQLQEQMNELHNIQDENKLALQDMIKTYERMSAKKAAPIITRMNDEEAVRILTNLKSEQLAAILENMQPEQAAKYTEMLTNKQVDS